MNCFPINKGFVQMIRIFSDSTSDLTKELIDKYNITILPLHITLGEEEYNDGQNISSDEIFAWCDCNKTTPKTSAISIDATIDAMTPVLEGGDEIIAFSISSSMSTTNNILNMIADDIEGGDRISVIDSKNLSTGIALLVIKAAEMAQQGLDRATIVQAIEDLVPKVRSSFVIDTLTYLHRGGRCSSIAALVGGVLKLHPKIVVEDGAMDVSKKYRGAIAAVVNDYVKDLNDELLDADSSRIFVTHSIRSQEILDNVRNYLESLNYFDEIIFTDAGGVISSHCGPGTLGLLFITK